MNETTHFDVAIVGGGLHGVSMASEAASRGLKVVLIQGSDLASGPTGSFRSIMRGGLRKIESLQLTEANSNIREVANLKRNAPHLLQLTHFKVLADESIRSNTKLRMALFVYRKMQQRQMEKAESANALPHKSDAFHYCDYQLKTSRLVISLALQAKNYGALILPQHRIEQAEREPNQWSLHVLRNSDKEQIKISAKVLINCCGWLANQFLQDVLKVNTRCRADVIHYAHAVVKKPAPFSGGYLLQQENKHFLYAHSLDDARFVLGPLVAKTKVADKEAQTQALNAAVDCWNKYQKDKPITIQDVLHCSWTARARIEDPLSNDKSVYRDSLVDLNNPGGVAPLLNVFGVNIAQHRVLSEQGLEILKPFTQAGINPQHSQQALPGGNLPVDIQQYIDQELTRISPDLHGIAKHLIENYGDLYTQILQDSKSPNDLGQHFGHGLYAAEVNYLLKNEWASCADDILWRRTTYGLDFSEAEKVTLDQWILESTRKPC